jgi:SPP1 gp7 family putative phage head morphogenesis protein
MRQPGIQHLRPSDYADMQDQILTALWKIVFQPAVTLIREVDPATAKVMRVENAAQTALELALQGGRVQYLSGVFSGDFNAQIAVEIRRMGGRFDKRMHVYFIDVKVVPSWVKAAAESFRSKAKALHEAIKRKLDETEAMLEQLIAEQRIDATKTVEKVQEGFRSAADAIGVSPTITPESKARMAREYEENMKPYVADFSKSAIHTLREAVEENAMKGYRADRLASVIRQRYGVTRSKAEFLARQETALFMSKYRELRFSEGGVTRYVWHTAHDELVRKQHSSLDGHTFFYSNPPIVDKDTARTGNPGTDFNCRCVDAPVLERIKVAA